MTTVELKPYDHDVADDIFSALFCKGLDREDGLKEIPSASLQLLISGLEYVLWDLTGNDRSTVKSTISILSYLRDVQKGREFRRKNSKEA